METKHSNNKNRDRIESQYLFIPSSHVIQLLTKIPHKICPEQNRADTRKGATRLEPSDEGSNMLAICYTEYKMIISETMMFRSPRCLSSSIITTFCPRILFQFSPETNVSSYLISKLSNYSCWRGNENILERF